MSRFLPADAKIDEAGSSRLCGTNVLSELGRGKGEIQKVVHRFCQRLRAIP